MSFEMSVDAPVCADAIENRHIRGVIIEHWRQQLAELEFSEDEQT